MSLDINQLTGSPPSCYATVELANLPLKGLRVHKQPRVQGPFPLNNHINASNHSGIGFMRPQWNRVHESGGGSWISRRVSKFRCSCTGVVSYQVG